MRPDQIRVHIRKQPFRPFRVHISDGLSYDVRHPEFISVSRAEVVIGLDVGDEEIPEHSIYCDPVHITRIDPLDGAKGRPRSPILCGHKSAKITEIYAEQDRAAAAEVVAKIG